jgi:hypothetical protein
VPGALIAVHPFGTPADVVSRLGAVRAQDYAAGKWAIVMLDGRVVGTWRCRFECAPCR